MAATSPPFLSLCGDSLALGGSDDVVCVDPSPQLLGDLLDAWSDATPAVATPSVDQLRTEVAEEPSERGGSEGGADGGAAGGAAGDEQCLPTFRVAARGDVLDEVLDGFHPASRASGLVGAELLSIVETQNREPNALIMTDADAAAIVSTEHGHLAIRDERGGTVRTAYEDLLTGEDADSYRIRTPSRRSLYCAYANRCSPDMADDVLRLLDRDPELSRGDPCDQLDRVYAIAARHGAVNYGIRRGAEDSGLASPSTLSSVKAELEEAGLIDTEPVPRPVGRPRQRIVPVNDDLAAVPLETVPEVVASATNCEKDS